MNREWLRLVMRRKSFGLQASLSEAAKRMFFMASTDLDTFRKFVFESSFLDTYEVDPETIERLRTDDTELMLFFFKYLASTFFGTPDLTIRQEKVASKAAKLKKHQEGAVRRAEQIGRAHV